MQHLTGINFFALRWLRVYTRWPSTEPFQRSFALWGLRVVTYSEAIVRALPLIFCGSLYAMTLTGARWLGAVTPLGGLAFIAAWIALATAAIRGE